MNKRMISNKEAVCQFTNCSWDEIEDYRYQPTRTSSPIYAFDSFYVCVTANGKQPPNKRDFDWKEASGQTAEWLRNNGRTVWIFNV